jgi:hypothetical protein
MTTTRGISALLGTRPAGWVGDRSYGWYLWHWPFIVFAAAMWPHNSWILVVVAVGSLVPAALSYRLVENPIRFNDRLTGRRVLPLVFVCITVPIAACLGLLLVNQLEARTGVVKAYSAATALHHGDTWPVDHPRGTIDLVGDSNAGQFSEPVAQVANQMGYTVNVGTRAGCPFADVVRETKPSPTFDGQACFRFVTDSLAVMKAKPPDLVIVAMSSSQVLNAQDDSHLRDPHTGEVATTPEAKARLWEDGLASVLRQLTDAGIPTLVIHPVPHLGDDAEDWQAETCPLVRIYDHSCGTSIDRATVEHQQQLARDAEHRAVARVPGSAEVDFTDDLCSAEVCTTQRDGLWMYRDATHLSVKGALTLTDRFRELIVDHVARH